MSLSAHNLRASVVIPAWNLWGYTRDCLESLAACTPGGQVEVIVVDNGSTDATRDSLEPLGRSLFGDNFIRLRFEDNLGFAKGCNSGATAARSDRLFFLNNDTVATAGWLDPLLACLDSRANIGVAASLLLYPDRLRAGFPGQLGQIDPEKIGVQHCGVSFTPDLAVRHHYAFFPADHPLVLKRRQYQTVTGAAMLLRKKDFDAVGGFCTEFKNGFEDLDLCFQLRKAGFFMEVEPASKIFHLASQTPGRNKFDAENAKLINDRHPPATPDLHRLLLNDGFQLTLNENLELYPAIDPGLETQLTRSFGARFDLERCQKRLHDQPLWQGGYQLMARALEAEGNWEEAACWKILQARIAPSASLAPGIQASLKRVSDPVLTRQLDYLLGKLSVYSDPKFLLDKARAMARWSRQAGQPVLEKLYLDFVDSREVGKNFMV